MSQGPVVIYDGVCNLCQSFVTFIIKRDEAGRIAFASSQGDKARELLKPHNMNPDELDSVVMITEDDDVLTKSDAALRIAEYLGGIWKVLSLLTVVPSPVRDWVYTFIASHRYRWFGKKDECWVPSEDVQSRFLD